MFYKELSLESFPQELLIRYIWIHATLWCNQY